MEKILVSKTFGKEDLLLEESEHGPSVVPRVTTVSPEQSWMMHQSLSLQGMVGLSLIASAKL